MGKIIRQKGKTFKGKGKNSSGQMTRLVRGGETTAVQVRKNKRNCAARNSPCGAVALCE